MVVPGDWGGPDVVHVCSSTGTEIHACSSTGTEMIKEGGNEATKRCLLGLPLAVMNTGNSRLLGLNWICLESPKGTSSSVEMPSTIGEDGVVGNIGLGIASSIRSFSSWILAFLRLSPGCSCS